MQMCKIFLEQTVRIEITLLKDGIAKRHEKWMSSNWRKDMNSGSKDLNKTDWLSNFENFNEKQEFMKLWLKEKVAWSRKNPIKEPSQATTDQ